MAKKTTPQKLPVKQKKEVQKEIVSTAVVVSFLEKKADPVIKKLSKSGSIICQADFDTSASQVKFIKEVKKEGEKEKKGMTDGIKQSLKRIDAFFKPFFDRIDEAEKEVKIKMDTWLKAQEAKEAKLLGDFKSGKVSVSAFSKKQDSFAVKSGGGASIKNNKVLEITDIKKIPREYMVPDETAIRNALLSGTSVPGAKMAVKKTIAI